MEIFPNAQRSIGQARSGHEVPDVKGTPFWVECTKGSQTIQAKIRQAQADVARTTSYPDALIAVVSRKKGVGQTTIVSMPLEDWLCLARLLRKKK